MNKIEELEFLKELEGKTGRFSDSPIIINCGMIGLKKADDTETEKLLLQISIRSQWGNGKTKTLKVLKDIWENNCLSTEVEKLIVNRIEEGIKARGISFREEIKELLGISEEKKEEKIENEINPEGGTGDYETNN